MELLITFANITSLFAGILCIAAFYNASVTIFDHTPKLVITVPWVLALLLVAYAGREGWFPEDNIVVLSASVIGVLLGGWAAFCFVLSFLYGWVCRSFLDGAVPEKAGRFSPVMYAWTAGILVMLLVTALNNAVHGKTLPFYIPV
jgi:hypothetical protein